MPPKSSKHPRSKIPSKKEYQEFSIAHQNVLLERMEKQFAVFGEGQILLREKVEALDCKVETLDHKLEKFASETKERLERLEEIISEILNRLKSLESRVSALESKWDTLPTL